MKQYMHTPSAHTSAAYGCWGVGSAPTGSIFRLCVQNGMARLRSGHSTARAGRGGRADCMFEDQCARRHWLPLPKERSRSRSQSPTSSSATVPLPLLARCAGPGRAPCGRPSNAAARLGPLGAAARAAAPASRGAAAPPPAPALLKLGAWLGVPAPLLPAPDPPAAAAPAGPHACAGGEPRPYRPPTVAVEKNEEEETMAGTAAGVYVRSSSGAVNAGVDVVRLAEFGSESTLGTAVVGGGWGLGGGGGGGGWWCRSQGWRLSEPSCAACASTKRAS
jgi:hypothetical protein